MTTITVWSKPQALEEAAAILDRAMVALLATARQTGEAWWELHHAVGEIRAEGIACIADGSLGDKAINAFNLARQAGATFDLLDTVRRKMIAETPKQVPGQAVAHLMTRLALTQMSFLASRTEYASREDALVVMNRISAAFAPAEDDAADEQDPMTYRSLVAMRGAVVRDLADRARRLPHVINYSFAEAMPGLWLANRIYADASRSDELRAENKWVHPAFAPPEGICLSR